MKIRSKAFGELDFDNAGDGVLEAKLRLDDKPVAIEVAWEGNDSLALGRILGEVCERLESVFNAGRTALETDLADPSAEFGVAMYAQHHREELPEKALVKTLGNANPSDADFLARLHPYGVRVDQDDDEGYYTLDYGIGREVTDYLVCVRLDAQCSVTEVVVES